MACLGLTTCEVALCRFYYIAIFDKIPAEIIINFLFCCVALPLTELRLSAASSLPLVARCVADESPRFVHYYTEIVAILMAMAARWPVNMGSKLHLPLPVKLAPSLPPLLLKQRQTDTDYSPTCKVVRGLSPPAHPRRAVPACALLRTWSFSISLSGLQS